jgi:hypothetical protein
MTDVLQRYAGGGVADEVAVLFMFVEKTGGVAP